MNELLLKNGSELVLPKIVGPEFVNHWMPEDFTNEQHHAHLESTSSSSLKTIVNSPYSYLRSLMDKQNGVVSEASPSMKFGTIVHMMLLEPDKFKRHFVMSPKFDLRKPADRELKKQFLDSLPVNAVTFDEEEYEDFLGVVNAIANHEKARDIFKEGVTERTGFFRDPVTGILQRFRPDFISTREDLSMFIDLKTAKDSSYNGFQKQMWNLRYDIQLAMYREGIKAVTGSYPQISGWVVVENKAPYEVAIYTVNDEFLERSHAWYRYALDRLAKCINEKYFPQRQKSAENMTLPSYAIMTEIPTL
jgi:hypothetical protein